MKRAARLLYGAAGAAAKAAAAAAPPGSGKTLAALRARRGIAGRFERWAATARDRARGLVWVHASSVGEGLQAAPVLALLRQRRPDLQLVYTYFSPSASRFAGSVVSDYADFLPFDVESDMTSLLDSLRPSLLVFSKLDVWPVLVECARHRGVPLALLSASLPADSRRLAGASAAFVLDSYRAMDRIGAVSPEDAERFAAAGLPRSRIEVTGDTRFDQVAERARSAAGLRLVAELRSARRTLVAGSTWPSDEKLLLPAWQAALRATPGARLLIAPHEISRRQLARVERWAGKAELTASRVDADGARTADCVIVDRYGVLGDLYALADVAYVGGGFQRAGLHSVLEPAAFGVPVIFGARSMGRDAELLENAGGGAAVAGRADIEAALRKWIGDAQASGVAGRAARALVEKERGAAERAYALISDLLPGA